MHTKENGWNKQLRIGKRYPRWIFHTRIRISLFWDSFWIPCWINFWASTNGAIILSRSASTSSLRGPTSRNFWGRRKGFPVWSLWSKLGRRRRSGNVRMSARNSWTSSYGGIKKLSTTTKIQTTLLNMYMRCDIIFSKKLEKKNYTINIYNIL